MIKRLQRGITVFLLLGAVGWLAVCLVNERTVLGILGAAVLLLGHAMVLAFELGMMRLSSAPEASEKLRWRDIASAWLSEVWCAPRVFCWRQPFQTHRWPDQPFVTRREKRGLLFVHGFLCNRAVWNGWYPRLRALDVPYLGVSMEPVFGSIDEYAEQIDSAVRELTEGTGGRPPLIVAHSMGGLAVRAWLRSCGPSALGRVHRVVTLGTPHRGTALVKLGVCANVREMAPNSEWLRRMAACEPRELQQKFICVYSRYDNVVFPVESAWLHGAERVEIPACAHVQMVDHPDVFVHVLDILNREE